MYNTPPVFPVHASLLTFQRSKNLGGIAAVEKLNKTKADLLYSEIDNNPLFIGVAAVEDRSLMNVTFCIWQNEAHQEKFDNFVESCRNFPGLAGHRSVGGYRASIYNAMPIESVQVLVDVMKELENGLK